MPGPRQHHYLPKKSFLKLFEIPSRPNFIYQYERNKQPIVTNILNAAKERHLYTFQDADGKGTTLIERSLATIENQAQPVLRKIAGSTEPMSIKMQEKVALASFIAYQTVRTPAFRDGIGRMTDEIQTRILSMGEPGSTVFDQVIDEAKQAHPKKSPVGAEMLRQSFHEGKIRIQTDAKFAMILALGMADSLIPMVMMKKMHMLKAPKGSAFVTSDFPVSLIRQSDVPPMYGGFAFSDIAMPIGSETTLYLSNPPGPLNPRDPPLTIGLSEVDSARVNLINSSVVKGAERYVYSSAKDNELQAILDTSIAPIRFTVS